MTLDSDTIAHMIAAVEAATAAANAAATTGINATSTLPSSLAAAATTAVNATPTLPSSLAVVVDATTPAAPILLNRRQPVRAPVKQFMPRSELVELILKPIFLTASFACKPTPLPAVIQTSLPSGTKPLFPTKQGFVGIASAAYNRHHALILRPDDVWQALVIQFSFYVQAHAKALRERLVDFQGKKELIVSTAGTLYTVDYGALSESMVDQIRLNIRDPSVADWLLPAFTTTTTNDRVVAAISIMATLQSYFDYKFSLCCGIPYVQLLGTVADWQQLQAKLERFLEFQVDDGGGGSDLRHWVESLRPILAEMLATRRGADNMVSFWEHILSNSGGGSGPQYISGWIRAFCAFTDKGVYQGRKERINTNDITTGVLSVPVTVDDNGTEHKCSLIAGQMGADVIMHGVGLQPRSDWMIVLGQQTAPTVQKKPLPGRWGGAWSDEENEDD